MTSATLDLELRQPTKSDLQRLLVETRVRAEAAEAALLSLPATATPPPGGYRPQPLLAQRRGAMRVWLMDHEEGYRLQLIHMSPEGYGWEMTKWSNGARYHLFEPSNGEDILCDCPGCTHHGPRCNEGRGCKHIQMLRTLRHVATPDNPVSRAESPSMGRAS